jgi:hypothetical protein
VTVTMWLALAKCKSGRAPVWAHHACMMLRGMCCSAIIEQHKVSACLLMHAAGIYFTHRAPSILIHQQIQLDQAWPSDSLLLHHHMRIGPAHIRLVSLHAAPNF